MNTEISVKRISDYLLQAFPETTASQQQLSLTLYQLLARGKPVSMQVLQSASGIAMDTILQTLQEWNGVYFDNENRVIGFWGLTPEATSHRMIIDGNTSYTWCAWDTLFIPALLQTTAQVYSHCPVTGNKIKLNIAPTKADAVGHSALSVSFVMPELGEIKQDVTSNFCHYIHFFDNPEVAQQWRAEHPGTFLLSLNDAFEVGQQVNTTRFNLIHKQG